jgi:reverse gyrase
MRYIKVCPICGNTFETNVEHRQACKACLEQSNPNTVSNMLKTLDLLGWSDLIDSRWRDKVIEHLHVFYDNKAPIIDIYKTLEIILV